MYTFVEEVKDRQRVDNQLPKSFFFLACKDISLLTIFSIVVQSRYGSSVASSNTPLFSFVLCYFVQVTFYDLWHTNNLLVNSGQWRETEKSCSDENREIETKMLFRAACLLMPFSTAGSTVQYARLPNLKAQAHDRVSYMWRTSNQGSHDEFLLDKTIKCYRCVHVCI